MNISDKNLPNKVQRILKIVIVVVYISILIFGIALECTGNHNVAI